MATGKKRNRENPAEWLLLDEETDVMNVPGGVLVRSKAWNTRFGTQAISTVFVPLVAAVPLQEGVVFVSTLLESVKDVVRGISDVGRVTW
jgi:hypothetical protein